MHIVHVYLQNKFGNVKIHSFDYDDGKPTLTSREIVMDYDNQQLDDILEELSFKFAEEININAQAQE